MNWQFCFLALPLCFSANCGAQENYYANEYPDEESVDTEDYEDHRHFDEYGSDDEDGTSSNDSFN